MWQDYSLFQQQSKKDNLMVEQDQLPNSHIPFKKPSYRMGKVNAHIKRVFGDILQKEADLPADALITISEVETANNLRTAIVWISVLPVDKARQAIKKLKPQMYHLQGTLNRELEMRPLPRISLRIDYGAEYSDKIERRLADLD